MLYEFKCRRYDCAFMIRTTDDEEILDHVTKHEATIHGRAVDRSAVEDALDTV
ncbi:DUF1059 domain-containing protein [Haloarchaeobius sp. DFWS5]|uniref:DUF1059 domain-containing protein n=1 Tax=Haloarchaeobius sp. DFWS5 TaxID=3446114 RepID=UPI003EC0D34B